MAYNLANFQPELGSALKPRDPLQFDLLTTTAGFTLAVISLRLYGSNNTLTVYDGDEFLDPFKASSVVNNSGDLHFILFYEGGWPAAVDSVIASASEVVDAAAVLAGLAASNAAKDMGGGAITNVGAVDGVDVSTLPGLITTAQNAADAAAAAIAAAVTDTGGGAGNASKLVKLDGDGKLDGRDVQVDGAKLDKYPSPGAVGRIIYSDGNNFVELAAGTEGKILTAHGAGAPTWETPAGGTVPQVEWSYVSRVLKGRLEPVVAAGNFTVGVILCFQKSGLVSPGPRGYWHGEATTLRCTLRDHNGTLLKTVDIAVNAEEEFSGSWGGGDWTVPAELVEQDLTLGVWDTRGGAGGQYSYVSGSDMNLTKGPAMPHKGGPNFIFVHRGMEAAGDAWASNAGNLCYLIELQINAA